MAKSSPYTVQVETVLEKDCDNECEVNESNASSCFVNDFSDIDVVIDMFANHIELNDGYEITQSDIDQQFVIPVPKQQLN